MGKKNIQPTTSSPVSRTLVVAPRPALEELRAEPQEGHISSLTGPDPSYEVFLNGGFTREGLDDQWGYLIDPVHRDLAVEMKEWVTSYDGDDE